MILQKIASSIRRQDWFQVAIEVLIVIIGIFLGLQVQNWYEDIADRKLERVFLERLLADVDRAIPENSVAIETGYNQNEALNRAYMLMYNGQVSEENRQEFSEDFFRSIYWVPSTIYPDTIDEMVSSGQITLIQSHEVRGAISRLRDIYTSLMQIQYVNINSATQRLLSLSDLLAMDAKQEVILNSPEELNGDTLILRQFRMLMAIRKSHNNTLVLLDAAMNEYREKVLTELEKHK